MKSHYTRRSFIKKSAVGAVAAANASLLTGLISADDASGGDIVICELITISKEDSPFLTEQAAIDAAFAARDDESNRTRSQFVAEDYGYTQLRAPIQDPSIIDVNPTIEQIGEGEFAGLWKFRVYIQQHVTYYIGDGDPCPHR